MKRVCIFITLIVVVLTCFFAYKSVLSYYNRKSNSNSDSVLDATKDIEKIDETIAIRKEDLEKVKENNKEKVEVYEVWEKELAKVKEILQ